MPTNLSVNYLSNTYLLCIFLINVYIKCLSYIDKCLTFNFIPFISSIIYLYVIDQQVLIRFISMSIWVELEYKTSLFPIISQKISNQPY